VEKVLEAKNWTQRGKEANDQINILGDDGVPIEYHTVFWKSETIDFVLMQQDAFDAIDSVTPYERQKYMLDLVLDICAHGYEFDNFEQVGTYFKRVINSLKQMNYSEFQSEEFKRHESDLSAIILERSVAEEPAP
jgi:V/A-type H+-transporting ATPase subunit A